MIIAFYIILIGSMICFGGSAICALYWAASTGQFRDMTKGSETIFGEDEPIGEITDSFPGINVQEEIARKKEKKNKRFLPWRKL
ncbi:MAG: cbb3-type cytochrome oxidase assembly protein [Verrucomicrobiota bacterium]